MKKNTILAIAGVGLGVLLLTSAQKDGENISFTLGGGGYSTGVGASTQETPTIYNITNEYNIPAADLTGLFDFNDGNVDNTKDTITKKSTVRRLREPLEQIVSSPTYSFTKSLQQSSGAQMTYVDEALSQDPLSLNNILNKKSDLTNNDFVGPLPQGDD